MTSLLEHLKLATRAEHDAIERALDLMGALDLARYRRVLERFYGVYRPLEERLGDGIPGLDLRAQAPLIARDLAALGADPAAVATCTALPDLTGLDARVGCVYVLEGAALGGQVISRHVEHALGIGPETGGRFFHGYGAATAARWAEVRAALEATGASRARAAAAAAATFRTLHAWCLGGH